MTTATNLDAAGDMHLPPDLESCRIAALPSAAYYISDFISSEEESMLLQRISTAPKPRWKQLSHRRLQTWPSELASGTTLLEAALPQWLVCPVIDRLLGLPVSSARPAEHVFAQSPHRAPNHVLVNVYEPGQGIMPHRDGPAYFPVVCTVSLGSALCLDIEPLLADAVSTAEDKSKPRWRVLQEPRSLLITTGQLYTDHMHGIAEATSDDNMNSSTIANWDLLRADGLPNPSMIRQTRTSLTYRDVVKVSKLGTKLGLFTKR